MKLASFLYQGKRSYGIVQAEGVIDLGRRLGDRYSDLKALLQGNGLAQATRYLNDAVDVPMSAITFLPVIEQPEKILCVGMNYADKRKEFDQHNPAPTLFVRFPDSQTGHNEPVLKPRHSSEFDYEGELAVIIGKGGENIRREEALRHVNPAVREHDLKVVACDEPALVNVDARLMVQLVVNLVNNAITYTPAGSHIVISISVDDGRVACSVADDGPGIAPEDRERIFESFYTANNGLADSHRSVGLGLSLCRSIALAHGGSIEVAAADPHGSVFTIELPVADVSFDKE